MTKSAGNAFRQMIEAGGDIGGSLAEHIRCPALLIAGEHDFLATPPVVRALAERISRGEFLEAAGAGHGIHHERPAWLFEEVVNWLSRVRSVAVSDR
jgi:pimeloyl-ACP methyl ester carboxylesterase